jgi:UDP-glucose 4-epimerase
MGANRDVPFQRAVVTGGAGFIGSHLVDALVAAGVEVTVLDNLSTGLLANLASAMASTNLTFHEVDILDPATQRLIEAASPQVVFHLAAQMDVRYSVREPAADARINVEGTVRVLQAAVAAGAERVVFASSGGCIYGPPDAEPIDETFPTQPHSPYGAAKVAAEGYVDCFARLYGIRGVSLALGNVYGPRQRPDGEAGVVAIFAQRLLQDAEVVIFGDGASSSRDYIHVTDVVKAFRAAAAAEAPASRYNIGSGIPTTVTRLLEVVAEACCCTPRVRMAPSRLGELNAITLRCDTAKSDLSWSPEIGLRNGIEETVAWIKAQDAAATA